MCVSSLSGTTDVSFIDPVVIGRNAFNVTNDFVSGIAAYIQDVLCAVLDVTLDSLQGRVPVNPLTPLPQSAMFTDLSAGRNLWTNKRHNLSWAFQQQWGNALIYFMIVSN